MSSRNFAVQEPVRLSESYCPLCKHPLDAVSGLKTQYPKPGDVTVCAYCGAILMFTEDLTLRRPTEDESAEMRKDLELWDLLNRVSARFGGAARN